ncbi:MAG: DUF4168 domain-containing protein [Xenococcaceae cyanobacterium MO_167.B27]|nr:DUF4168 domain-containing protein [Xenococcaceae cyanobacterium MO_167.B27]
MFKVNISAGNLSKIWIRLINVSSLASLGILFGIVPQILPQSHRFSFEYNAYAGNYTQQEISNYARAGLQIERLRRRTYQEIKKQTNQRPPNIVCNRPETIQQLSPNIRNIANNYCQETTNIIRNNNLTIRRFNELKRSYDGGGEFHRQVQQMLLRLQ